ENDLTNSPVTVYDAAGKRLLWTTVRNNRIAVEGLSSGVYVVEVLDHGRTLNARFTKH
ncbi:MAG: T9SS type A sorting domain-containing protein, partial [Bacteroidetes bacterium]|nr:T9SS type A sorting domain-containing protein [Bacteroidota bacterium]